MPEQFVYPPGVSATSPPPPVGFPKSQTSSGKKMVIYNSALGIYLEVQYNPVEIIESKALGWNFHTIQGMSQPLTTFGCGEIRRKRFELFLDAHASPHPYGHVAHELQVLRYLTVPFGRDGKPTVLLPNYAGASQASAMMQALPGGQPAGTPSSPVVMPLQFNQQSVYVGGVPPVVKISYAGRVETAFVANLEIKEVLHGTTPASRASKLPTRANVSIEFNIADDPERMFVTFSAHART